MMYLFVCRVCGEPTETDSEDEADGSVCNGCVNRYKTSNAIKNKTAITPVGVDFQYNGSFVD